jgi:hypothetical protein
LHAIDENVAREVAPLLAYLRWLQRHHHIAVALEHHVRKGAAHERDGPALRRSSELHVWGDSICVATARSYTSISSIAPPLAPTGCSSPLKATPQRSLLRLSSRHQPRRAWQAISDVPRLHTWTVPRKAQQE